MVLNVLYILLIVSITGFLISGMLSILQFGGWFKNHKQRYAVYFIIFAAFTIILMGVFTIIAM